MKTYFEETLERASLALGDYGCKITFIGFCGALIEGHKGLYDYSPDCVAVRVGRKKVTIRGKNFTVKDLTSDELIVCGKINGMDVEDV